MSIRKAACISTFAAALMLSACNITTPSQVKTGQIRVTEQMKTVVMDARSVDVSRINIISDDYARNGKGDVRMVFTYTQGDPLHEIEAKKHAKSYISAFSGRGLKDVVVDYVPIADKLRANQAIVTYLAMTALPPENCGRLTGHHGADVLEAIQQYDFGCETKSALSQMISRPEDLMGRTGAPDDDARRQGALVEKYKSGTPNEKIQGVNASEIASGGGG